MNLMGVGIATKCSGHVRPGQRSPQSDLQPAPPAGDRALDFSLTLQLAGLGRTTATYTNCDATRGTTGMNLLFQDFVADVGRRSIALASSATAAATAASATTATAATATTAGGPGPGFVDVKRPTVEFGAVDRFNSCIGLTAVSHFDEPEATWPTGITVGDDGGLLDLAVGAEQIAKLILCRLVVKVADINFHRRHSNAGVAHEQHGGLRGRHGL